MTLGDYQRLFTRYITLQLFPWFYANGFEVTFGEVYRNHALELAAQKLDLSKLSASSNSTHEWKLAIDINLFRRSDPRILLVKVEDYRYAGEFWESLSNDSIECCWGGRWEDAGHFSFKYGNVK